MFGGRNSNNAKANMNSIHVLDCDGSMYFLLIFLPSSHISFVVEEGFPSFHSIPINSIRLNESVSVLCNGGDGGDIVVLCCIVLWMRCYFSVAERGWGTFSTKGSFPSPRFGHSATLMNNEEICVVGGVTDNEPFEEIWILNPRNFFHLFQR
jgi:hypothetical protein